MKKCLPKGCVRGPGDQISDDAIPIEFRPQRMNTKICHLTQLNPVWIGQVNLDHPSSPGKDYFWVADVTCGLRVGKPAIGLGESFLILRVVSAATVLDCSNECAWFSRLGGTFP